MKIAQLILIGAIVLASSIGSHGQRQSSNGKPMSPEQLVSDLYRQHKKRSPFFQIKSRALLDKYFTRELANLLWQDAHSSGGEVGALDGDPLFNAQDMKITNFSIQRATVFSGAASVPVSFENFGAKHQIVFQLIEQRSRWKIADLKYDDGASLLQILKSDSSDHR